MGRTPKPKSQRKDLILSVQVKPAMKQRLEEMARERGDIPVAQIVREAIEQYFAKAA